MSLLRSEVSWICQIAVKAQDGRLLDDEIAQEFFQFAQDWVENNGLQMGGLYYGCSQFEDPSWEEFADILEGDSKDATTD